MSFNKFLGIAQKNAHKTKDAFIKEIVDTETVEVEILSLGDKKRFMSFDKVALSVSTVDNGKVKISFDRYSDGTFSPNGAIYFSNPEDEDGYVELNTRGLSHNKPKLSNELEAYGMKVIENKTNEIEEKSAVAQIIG